VFLAYRIRDAARESGLPVGRLTGRTLGVVGSLVVLVAVPLALGSVAVARDRQLAADARPLATGWAKAAGWQIVTVDARDAVVIVTALGPPPNLDPAVLRRSLDDHGLAEFDLRISLVVGGTRFCPARAVVCSTTG
jgi:hypothetical protein